MKRFLIPQQEPQASTSKSSTHSHEEKCSSSGTSGSEDEQNIAVRNPCIIQGAKKARYYKHKFNDAWFKQFPWLQPSHNDKTLGYCRCCVRTISGSLTHLKRHECSEQHIKKLRASQTTPKITQTLIKDEKYISHEKNVFAAELKLTMFLHEHNLPFLLMEHLPKLVKSICPDSEIAKNIMCSRTKATALTNTCLVQESIEVFQKQLYISGGLYSIIIDESTDVSTKKSLAVIIRFCHNDEPKDRFLGLIEVISATAESLFNSVVELLNKNKIPLENMLGFAGDNASVIMGKTSGVQARFKEVSGDIFVLGCTCHSLHLCSSAACTKLPKSLEEFVRHLYNHFSNSPKRIGEFEEYQKFLLLEPHKMLRPAQTRWLSLQSVVDGILLLWDSLKLYFTNLVFENKDVLLSDNILLQNLNNTEFKIYLMFLSYILEIVNQMNLQFQSETTQIQNLYTKFTTMYKTILKNFVKRNVLENTEIGNISASNPHNLEDIYMGANVLLFLKEHSIDINELKKIRVNILSFYVELCSQIRKRFNFNDQLLIFLTNFQPKKAMSGDISTIVEAKLFFKKIELDIQQLDNEWRLLSDIPELKENENLSFNDFWQKVFKMKNQLEGEMFPNLKKVIKAIMCLPHSSACVERIFSKLNLIKTDLRNRLNVETCNSIMLSTELLDKDSCYSWQPQQSLLKKKPTYPSSKK